MTDLKLTSICVKLRVIYKYQVGSHSSVLYVLLIIKHITIKFRVRVFSIMSDSMYARQSNSPLT